MPVVSFGFSITVQFIADKGRWSACASNILGIPSCNSSMPPLTPVGFNQVEIDFSIVQRKVLAPNDFNDLGALAERLFDFQYYWESTAKPFEWKFTRQDLNELLAKLDQLTADRTA